MTGNAGIKEIDQEAGRFERLKTKPESASIEDVKWLTERSLGFEKALEVALKGQGRVAGILEAVEILERSCQSALKVQFFYGKRQQASMAINQQLLKNSANLIRKYADEVLKTL